MQKIEKLKELDKAIEEKGAICLVFSGEWCPDCRFLAPFFPEWEEKYEKTLSFLGVDFDEGKEVYEHFAVGGLPSFVIIKKGKEIARLAGPERKSKEQVEKLLAEHAG